MMNAIAAATEPPDIIEAHNTGPQNERGMRTVRSSGPLEFSPLSATSWGLPAPLRLLVESSKETVDCSTDNLSITFSLIVETGGMPAPVLVFPVKGIHRWQPLPNSDGSSWPVRSCGNDGGKSEHGLLL